jgi:hypothetical protein
VSCFSTVCTLSRRGHTFVSEECRWSATSSPVDNDLARSHNQSFWPARDVRGHAQHTFLPEMPVV